MKSYLIKSSSPDITFCASLCRNMNCSRNMNCEMWSIAVKSQSAVCDFSHERCSDYKEEGE